MRIGTTTRQGVHCAPGGGLTEDEREWIVAGMAWVGLQRWRCGQAAGDAARVWFQAQMDVQFGLDRPGRYITPDMVALETEMAQKTAVLGQRFPTGPDSEPRSPARMPEFGPG